MLIHNSESTERLILSMPSGMWYGNGSLDLEYPANWDVSVLQPETPREMTTAEIVSTLERPTGQPPLREMCSGARRPVIIIDDVNRPTPVAAILPILISHFRQAGIPARDVSIVLATGAHAAPQMESVRSKVGEVAATCRTVVHDCNRDLIRLGNTSFGTPVLVNKVVAASDFVIGIGGIYPNYTAGFGGGSKLTLGVLGFRSILSLHHSHTGAGRGLRAERDT